MRESQRSAGVSSRSLHHHIHLLLCQNVEQLILNLCVGDQVHLFASTILGGVLRGELIVLDAHHLNIPAVDGLHEVGVIDYIRCKGRLQGNAEGQQQRRCSAGCPFQLLVGTADQHLIGALYYLFEGPGCRGRKRGATPQLCGGKGLQLLHHEEELLWPWPMNELLCQAHELRESFGTLLLPSAHGHCLAAALGCCTSRPQGCHCTHDRGAATGCCHVQLAGLLGHRSRAAGGSAASLGLHLAWRLISWGNETGGR